MFRAEGDFSGHLALQFYFTNGEIDTLKSYDLSKTSQ